MADLGTLVTIAEKVFQILQSPILQDMKDFKSELTKLNQTVSSIKNMLRDADKKTDFTHEERGWIDQLKEVLYDADDLFDEVVTLAKLKELSSEGVNWSKKVSKKVGRFFTSKNHFLVSYNTSQEVKSIQQKLADIARDHERYGFKVDSQSTRNRRLETCSFLDNSNDGKIIGRDGDVKNIINMLDDSNVIVEDTNNVDFIVVVGVGGLGKTALAQLVFNHNTVKSKFENKRWVCVSDQDGQHFDVKIILSKVLENKPNDDVSTMEGMGKKLQDHLGNKKYFLVLDDVWTENGNEWKELRKYLIVGGQGSKILITTRSEKTADVVLGRRDHPNKYMLGGLTNDDAWVLFEVTAFERGSSHVNHSELVNVGKNILAKCSNVPLAIKVIGTFLHSLKTSTWRSFEKSRLCDIVNEQNPILSVLELSYNNLKPSLKSCFVYCALFPKDFEIEKELLISLWIAQEYVVPLNKNQSIEDAAQDHFLILLKRCFFQDVKKDEFGEVHSFKIHDLMHDLAQEVVGNEFGVTSGTTENSWNLRHLFIDRRKRWTECSINKSNIRSYYVNVEVDTNLVKKVLAKWTCIRTLKLELSDCESLPDSINKLLHLRFLDLSGSYKLMALPNTITQLYNLQSLILRGCSKLIEWPDEFGKLVNLRYLDITYCESLSCMPLGIGRLVELCVLTDFILVDVDSSGSSTLEQLEDLKALVNLRGSIHLKFYGTMVSIAPTGNGWEGGCLEGIEGLKEVLISGVDDVVMEKLQPHRSVKQLRLMNYKGVEIPRWGRVQDDWAILLPNLVTINLVYCERLIYLPSLHKLVHLKSLTLEYLGHLEYIEDGSSIYFGSSDEQVTFFPSLEFLKIHEAGKLKGWWKPLPLLANGDWLPSFLRLSKLIIVSCDMLTSFPYCPSLKEVVLTGNNEDLKIRTGSDTCDRVASHGDLKVRVDKPCYLASFSAVHLIFELEIQCCSEMESLGEFEEVFKTSCSSLLKLEFSYCYRLKSLLGGGLENFTALRSLSFNCCENLTLLEDDSGIPWRGGLHHNLRHLAMFCLKSMEYLPSGMKYLTSLQNLTITYCDNLKELPEWMSCLSSLHSLVIDSCDAIKSFPVAVPHLQKLVIIDCQDLEEACQESSGEDWPNIQHIPSISFRN